MELRGALQDLLALLDRPLSMIRRTEDEVVDGIAQEFWSQLHGARYPESESTKVLFRPFRTDARLDCRMYGKGRLGLRNP